MTLLARLIDTVVVPVVYIGADRADAVAVELRSVTYLPGDALVGVSECLVLRGIGA